MSNYLLEHKIDLKEYTGSKLKGVLGCLLQIHFWSPWTSPVVTEVWDSSNPGARFPINRKLTQMRACNHCRKIQSRTWKVL